MAIVSVNVDRMRKVNALTAGAYDKSGIIRPFTFCPVLKSATRSVFRFGTRRQHVSGACRRHPVIRHRRDRSTAVQGTDAVSPAGSIRLNASGESAVVPSAVIASLEGRPTVLATQMIDGRTTIYLIRTLADGTGDIDFGESGRAAIAGTTRCVGKMLLQNDGADTIVVAEMGTDDACVTTAIVGWRISASGRPDPTYAIGGLPSAKRSTPLQLIPDAGRLLLSVVADGAASAESATPVAQAYVAGINPRGSIDSTFGRQGWISLAEAPTGTSVASRIASFPDGRLIIATLVGKRVELSDWTASGQRTMLPTGATAPTFDFTPYAQGSSIVRLVDFHHLADGANLVIVQGESATANSMIIGRGQGTSRLVTYDSPATWPATVALPDASVVVAELSGSGVAATARLRRMYPDSSFDVTFGVGQAYPVGTTNVTIAGLARNVNGQLLVTGRDVEGGFLRMLGVGLRPNYAKRFAVEYYNSDLNHYFMTSDPAEIAAVDAGRAGSGWKRTSYGFNVHPVGAEVPEGAIAVCRFYGNTAINTATGRPYGPNSHVYLVDGTECANARKDPGWIYEGVVFYVYAYNARAGGCAYWQRTVDRFYNGRAAENDSNHRYTMNATFTQVELTRAAGFVHEGIAFCSPQ